MANQRYIIVSPVKDEEDFVERTIQSILRQTIRPIRWVIVDDGSTDQTLNLLNTCCPNNDWISVISRPVGAPKKVGGAVIRAFDVGYETVRNIEADFIVKMDCDLELPADYFEQMLFRFEANCRLGIASGVYVERHKDQEVEIAMPEYHAAGCLKMVRTECFREIGGFVAARGWDTIDEIRAQVLGWETRHFQEVKFHHLKLEGTALGPIAWNLMLGNIYYVTGGGVFFFLLKVVHRAIKGRPMILGAGFMLLGYLSAAVRRVPRLLDKRERRFYRTALNRRVWTVATKLLGINEIRMRSGSCT